MEERFYWPDYYKNTMEMVSYKLYLFANHPVAPRGGGGGGHLGIFWVGMCRPRLQIVTPF